MRWLLCLWCLTASAAELTAEQAMFTYIIAFGKAGFIPERAPVINIVPRHKLCVLADLRPNCKARGLTMPDGVIYLDDTLDFADAHDASVLLHEMVHYVDWAKGGPSTNCAEWLRREQRAYSIQAEALQKVGVDPSNLYLALRMMSCQDPK
jgi:hypothetical protein